MKKKGFLKRFMPYYAPYKGILALDLFCALVYSLAGLSFPVLVRYLLNNVIARDSGVISGIIIVASLMVGLKLLETACRYFMTTVGHTMGARFEADLRRELYIKLLNLSTSFYDNNKVGDLMSRVNNDLFDITEFSHHCPEELFIAVVRILGIFIYLMFINPILTLIIFAAMPFFIFVAYFFNGRLEKSFKERRKVIGEINSHLEDSLSGMSVVRSFANEKIELDSFEKDNKNFLETKRKSYKIMGLMFSETTISSGLLYILTIIVGVVFIFKGVGNLDIVDLMTYVLFVGTLLTSVEAIINYTEQFQQGKTGFSRFCEIMDEPITVLEPSNPIEHIDFSGDILFDNVTFGYDEGGKHVLNKLSFVVKSGQNVAIVGSSGAGKTTIANLIPRFYDVQGGNITIGGVNIRDMSLATLRENVGIVQQNVYMFNGTIKDNILYGRPTASMDEVMAAAREAGAAEFIDKLADGYDTNCGERGVKLSGGQKQRISIARLFLKNPPILILDEATSALDNESERIVQQSLAKLSRGRTSVVIAHRLTTIRNAEKIFVITENGIAEQGSHDELIAKGGIYSGLYKLYDKI